MNSAISSTTHVSLLDMHHVTMSCVLFHACLQLSTHLFNRRERGQQALRACLANLGLGHLESVMQDTRHQKQAYLGNNEDLHEYMKAKKIKTMTTRAVRTWLEENGSFPQGYHNAGLTLAGCDIDHILPATIGGQDHPYNYFILPKPLNGSFNCWWTCHKQEFMGRDNVRTAKNFFKWVKEQGRRLGLDCNDFHEQRFSM